MLCVWRLQAGSAGQPTVFLFSDNQMKEESFLEDINNILNTGAAPDSAAALWHSAAAYSYVPAVPVLCAGCHLCMAARPAAQVRHIQGSMEPGALCIQHMFF